MIDHDRLDRIAMQCKVWLFSNVEDLYFSSYNNMYMNH